MKYHATQTRGRFLVKFSICKFLTKNQISTSFELPIITSSIYREYFKKKLLKTYDLFFLFSYYYFYRQFKIIIHVL